MSSDVASVLRVESLAFTLSCLSLYVATRLWIPRDAPKRPIPPREERQFRARSADGQPISAGDQSIATFVANAGRERSLAIDAMMKYGIRQLGVPTWAINRMWTAEKPPQLTLIGRIVQKYATAHLTLEYRANGSVVLLDDGQQIGIVKDLMNDGLRGYEEDLERRRAARERQLDPNRISWRG